MHASSGNITQHVLDAPSPRLSLEALWKAPGSMLAIRTAAFAGSRSQCQSKSISEFSRNHGRHELILFCQL